MTSIIVIAAIAALVAVRLLRPRAYQVQGFLFIGICILVGWLLAVGSTSNETNIVDGQSNSQDLEVLAPEASRPSAERSTDEVRTGDGQNATASTGDYENVDMNADEVPEMNVTNTNY